MSARNIWWQRNRKPLLPIYYNSRKGFHTYLAFYRDYYLSQWSVFTQGFAPTYPIFCWWSRSDVIMLNLSHHTHLHCNRVWWKSQNYDLPVGSSKGERGMGKKMPLLYTKSAVRCTKKNFFWKVGLLFRARLLLCRRLSSDYCEVAPNIYGVSWPPCRYNKTPCSMNGQRLTVKDTFCLSLCKYGILQESPLTYTGQPVFKQVLLGSTLQQAPFLTIKRNMAYTWQNSTFNINPTSIKVQDHVLAQKEIIVRQKKWCIVIQAW